MTGILQWTATYVLSALYYFVFWVFSRENAISGGNDLFPIFDWFNIINAVGLFPISSMWFRNILHKVGHQTHIGGLPMDRGNGPTYFTPLKNGNQSRFILGGIDTALFKNAELLVIYLINYVVALPLLILLSLSQLFGWQLFERIILAIEKYRYQEKMKLTKFVKPIDVAEITRLFNEHQAGIVFIGSPDDVMSRMIAKRIIGAAKLNSVVIHYFDVAKATDEENQTVLSKLHLYSSPKQLPALVRIGSDGSVSPVDFDRIDEVIRLWTENPDK